MWRYKENKRNYPGYHLTADREGCESLEKILANFETSQKARDHRFDLTPVTQAVLDVPNNASGNATVVSLKPWRLFVDPTQPEGFFEFSERHPACDLKLSPQQAGCVLEGVRDISKGKGDYCIGGDGDHVIWFWWFRA